ncbi:hypothetical protein [Streptomyces sp. NPDC000983]|uniref:hypothetical protein n=1 Tax=Streptomyces sp. NPDC000983 TaxID=3154373 RepID=UPI003324B7FF
MPRTPAVRDSRHHQGERTRAHRSHSERTALEAAPHEAAPHDAEQHTPHHPEHDTSPNNGSDPVLPAQRGETEHRRTECGKTQRRKTEHRKTEAAEEPADALGVPVGIPLLRQAHRNRHTAEYAPSEPVTSHPLREPIAADPDLLDPGDQPWPGGTRHRLPTGLPAPTPPRTSYDLHDPVVKRSRPTPPGDRTEPLFTTDQERW